MSLHGRQRDSLQRLLAVGPEISTTPLIDVVFLLLIFFLCTLRFRAMEARLALDLPLDRGSGGLQALAAEPLRIELIPAAPAAEGRAAWPLLLRRRGAREPFGTLQGLMPDPTDARKVLLAAEPADTLPRFEAWLREVRSGAGDMVVRVEADGRAAHAAVVAVIDTVLATGFQRVDFSSSAGGAAPR